MLKRSTTWAVAVDIVDGRTVKVELTKDELLAVKNKEVVFEQFSYGTPVYTRDSESNPHNKVLYYDFSVDEVSLDDYRLEERTEDEDSRVKEYIIGGLLSTLYLVSEGKIYATELNPLNFIYDQRRNKVKAFYRKDHALGEITDKWLYDVKKLVAFYLSSDTGLMPERFEQMRLEDIEPYLSDSVLGGYYRLKEARSVGEMAEMLLSEKEMLPLKSYPSVFPQYKKPRDITTEIGYIPGDSYQMEEEDLFYVEESQPKKVGLFKKGKNKKDRPKKEKPVKEKKDRQKKEKPVKANMGTNSVPGLKKDMKDAERIIREERRPSSINKGKMLIGIVIGIVIGILFDRFVLGSTGNVIFDTIELTSNWWV